MSSYSLGGYKIAALARSRKTLVVEGRTDSLVLKRIFLEQARVESGFPSPLVDIPDIVKDASLSGLGNREKVKQVVAALGPSPKIAGLVDREWDGFCLDSLAANDEEESASPIFVTKGHSIENYFFDLDICREFIARRYSDVVEAGLLSRLDDSFVRILAFAFAYSVVLARRQLVSKSASLISPLDIDVRGGVFQLLPTLVVGLRARGAAECSVEGLVEEVDEVQRRVATIGDAAQLSRWKCHGHLGDEAIWGCVGRLAISEGVSPEDANGIASGYKDERVRSAADALAKYPARRHSPVGALLEWARI